MISCPLKAPKTRSETFFSLSQGSVQNVFHTYTNQIDLGMHVNEEEPSIEKIGREESATLVYSMKTKDEYTSSIE